MSTISFDANGNIQWIGKDQAKRPVGRPRSNSPRKTHVTTTVSEDEFASIHTAAELCGMSLSNYVRTAVLQMTEELTPKEADHA